MGKDQTKASDHPTTNAVANTDSNGVATGDPVDMGGAYVGFSATNIKLDPAPEIGDTGVLMVKYECVGDGRKKAADGELRDRRSLKVLSTWRPNEKPAGEDPNQPGLYEIDPVNGAPADDPEPEDEDDDTVDTGPGAQIITPAFSDGGK